MKVLCNLLKINFRYGILKQRGDSVRRLMCLFMMTICLVSCGLNSGSDSTSQNSSVVQNSQLAVSSENITSSSEIITEPEIEYRTVRTSPNGEHSVCCIYDGYEGDYFIKNNTTGKMVEIGRFWSTDIEFISNTQFLFGYGYWCIYNTDGSIGYNLSDYFPTGLTEDGKDILIFSVHGSDDGRKFILFTDMNEIVQPEKFVNSGTFNDPHIYSVAVMSAENVIEKTINTGKHVETYKSLYTAPIMELVDDNTLYMYTLYWDGEKDVIGYEITINLSTGDCKIVDYRPEVEQ